MTRRTRQWPVPAGLIALCLVPVVAGSVRLAELSGGGPVRPENARFFAMPVPVVLHIVTATVFCLLGAFQFVPSLRRRPWHRLAGRVLVPCGLVAAVTGLWMTVLYPEPPGDGPLLYAFRLVFGTAMVAALVLGLRAVRRREFAVHRAWMMRGYAIGIGAGTQAVVTALWLVPFGTPDETTRALLLGAGWVINLAVVEWRLTRTPSTGRGTKTKELFPA
ncbi:DUF2306 domain-containing protein [Actinosynnema sp. NPDC023587]|uniref:DUF2306 domain-containing protein n=1 Tax=Actinosynnema sp. NPDC023587 TaxID=3154695 RepID=UPI0033C71B24